MKSNKGKGLIGLIIALALVGLFGYFGYTTMNDIKLGLDLAGGVSITYQAKEENPTAEDMSDTIYKLQQRVQNYSTEAEVYQEGSNRINVDIPGVSDANAILEELGKPGSLIFVDEAGQTILNGNQVATAKPVITDENGIKKYMVDLTFTDDGKTVFADATTKNVGKRIAIIYDGKIYSNPVVNEPITQGQCQISGMTSYEEAETLASTIRIGSLSLELEELRSNVVGAKLGQEAISTSLKAGAIGFGIVAVFMIIVYLVPGLAAVIALSLYVGLILILLSAFSVTLTLPGVAGIILSIGMAVDANVIIFTRIKEEIGLGKTVQSAIKSGFNKALSAIIDGNVTTLIAAGVLFWRGSGQTAPGGSRKTRPHPWTAPECFRPSRPSVPARRTWPVSPWAACRMPSVWMRAPPCIPIHPTGILIARTPAPIRFFLRQRRPQGRPIPHTAPICPVPPPWPYGPRPRYGAGSRWPRHSAQTAPWGRPEMHSPWDSGNPALAQAG